MNKIGIKLANGEFYPILADGTPAKKKLVVTTVNDDQKSVQIDLYRGIGPSVEGADYVGSLVVESIPAAPAGEPDLKLELEIDEAGILKATVREAESGEEQVLEVSLEALGEDRKYEIPDFDLEEERTDELPGEATSPEEGEGLLAAASKIREDRERAASPLKYIIGIIVLVAILAFAWYMFGDYLPHQAKAAPAPKPVATAPAPVKAAVQPPSTPAPATTAPAAVATPPAAAPAPAPEAAKATKYLLRWGDTLWDLSYVHYRDPWLFPRIAKANKIKNPDLIIAGTTILIPPR